MVPQWLKTYEKDIRYIAIIVVLVVISVLYNKHLYNKIPVQKPVYKPVEQKTDSKGNQYTEVKGTVYTQDQMKHIVDSVAKVLKVKPGNVTGVTSVTTIIDTFAHTTNTIYLDTFSHTLSDSISTKEYQLSYKGNYATRSGIFHLSLVPDTATYISVCTKHLLKGDEYKVDVYHTNQLFKPAQGYSYTSTILKTIAVIGPFIGLGYNGKIVPVIGVGITLNLFGIKRK